MTDLLDRAIEQAGIERDDLAEILLSTTSAARAIGTSSMTADEEAAFVDQPRIEGAELVNRMLTGEATARSHLTRNSLSVAEAAHTLDMESSGLRHRINRGSLYSFDLGKGQRIPTWQIIDEALIPHLSKVLHALRPHMTPLEMDRLMTQHMEELNGVTIPAWLSLGGDPAPVLRIAAATHHR